MSLQLRLGMIGLLWGVLGTPLLAQPAPGSAPQKRTLVLPIAAAPAPNQPAPSVQCEVRCGPPLPLSAIAFTPDAKLLAVGGYQEIVLWDLAGPGLQKRLGSGQLNNQVRALVVSKDGRLVIAGEGTPYGPGSVKAFDIATGQVAGEFQGPKDVVNAMALSPDGAFLAAGGVDRAVYVWNVADKKLMATLNVHSDAVLSLAFSANGKFLASGSADRSSQVWEAGTWKPLANLQQAEAIHGVAMSPDGELVAMAVAGPEEKGIRLRRRDNQQDVRFNDIAPAMPMDLLWIAQGNKAYVPGSDMAVRVFDAGNGGQTGYWTGHGDWVYREALTADGARLATASADGTVKLWNTANGRLLATLIQLTPRSDEWLLATSSGYLATSAPGSLGWKTGNVKTPPDKLLGLLQQPDRVRQALTGAKVDPPVIP